MTLDGFTAAVHLEWVMSFSVRPTISTALAGALAGSRAFAGAFDQYCGFDANQSFGWRSYAQTWRRT